MKASLAPSLPYDEAFKQDTNVSSIGAAVLRKEADALSIFATLLDTVGSELNLSFALAVNEIANRTGRIVVSGMGKSGHIARKMAATFASTGTPSFFVHPSEASHGDLGMVMPGDVVIVLSNSGKSRELSAIINYAKRFGMPLIAVTSNKQSPLGKAANINLTLPKVPEACTLGLAPTTSTTMTLALGDALAVAVMQMKGFTSADFGKFHPGGSLGNALQRVSEIMHKGEEIPLVHREEPIGQILTTINEGSFGCAGVINRRDQKLAGIITNDDLLRRLKKGCLPEKTAGSIMTRNPTTINPTMLTAEALKIMNEQGVAQLFVTDESKRPVGIVRVQDLLTAGVA